MSKSRARPKLGPYSSCTKPNQFVRVHQLSNWPDEGKKLPEWLLDTMADEKLYGPPRDRKNTICSTCFVRKTLNGTCFCTE
jgi:hypothetical protein